MPSVQLHEPPLSSLDELDRLVRPGLPPNSTLGFLRREVPVDLTDQPAYADWAAAGIVLPTNEVLIVRRSDDGSVHSWRNDSSEESSRDTNSRLSYRTT